MAGLPASDITPLQFVQNAAAYLVFNQLTVTYSGPISLKCAFAEKLLVIVYLWMDFKLLCKVLNGTMCVCVH